jgi:flagellar hook protein FlgE
MSSLLGSVSTAITGLMAQAASIGNISDNLANTTTTGFKTIGTSFADIVSSASCDQTGVGTIATPTYYNGLQGSLSFNTSQTNMAISGRGFFAVMPQITSAATASTGGTASSSSGTAASTGNIFYTRKGDFLLDQDGCLTNSSGYSLMGWNVDPTTGLAADTTLVPVQFSNYIDSGVVTENTSLTANLPGSVAIGTTIPGSQTTIYDSRGRPHDVSYSWEKMALNQWQLTATVSGGDYDPGTNIVADYTTHATFTFDGNTAQLTSVQSAECPVSGNSLSFSLSFQDYDAENEPIPNTAITQTVASGFNNLTQFADTAIEVMSFDQDGAGAGAFSGISIDNNGFAAVNYSNGVVRTYFQIPLATFNAPEDLQRETGGVFRETLTSGTATYNAAEREGAGKLAVGALENSTVDIADQFTRMIQAQRAYSANAKTVSVADSMLQTLVTI